MARLVASVGGGCEEGVSPRFVPSLDVSGGGVLLALPTLLAVGLLRATEVYFALPRGYYGMNSIFLLLGFLSLARVPSLEALRYYAPGEWGKLLGLDRAPEVRTLREKVKILSEQGQPVPWSAALCREWLEGSPTEAQTLYVDGHVRVYHGQQTRLPRHYVARQRLCLRASVDYWANAMDGQPFFVVHQDVDPGLVWVLENEIIPRLEREVPNQPTPEALAANPLLHRFTVVFDREGYSPAMMRDLRQSRIACLTYRKWPGDDWPAEEFAEHEVSLIGGETVTMCLAERGVFLGGVVWVREFRRLSESRHQTAIVTTNYQGEMAQLSAAMFARWSQENFFAYMRKHYGLDRIITYDTERIADTTRVVNPEYRRLDGEVRKKVARLTRVTAKFGSMGLDGDIDPARVAKYERKKAELQEEAEHLRGEVEELKAQRKAVKRHILFGDLPETERFERLAVDSKHMIDTVKMIAYRAETAMAHILREKLTRQDDARALLQCIYTTEADLLPDETQGTLTVCLHHMATRMQDEAVEHLMEELNATETVYPGTTLRLVFKSVSSQNPRDQEF